MKRLLIGCAAALLASCAGTPPPPVIVTKTVEKPVAVPCVPSDFPEPPVEAIEPKWAQGADAAERYLLLGEAWAKTREWVKAAAPAIQTCRKG